MRLKGKLLLIFIKNPIPRKVKTRLGKNVGYNKAVDIYRKLMHTTREASMTSSSDNWLYYSDFIDTNDDWPSEGFEKKLQQGRNLGEKMEHAFKTAFVKGYKRVIIIGSDCPEISGELLDKAFYLLDKNEVVIGPALDGGYYLLGMKRYYGLFENKEWSTDSVLKETRKELEKKKISYATLKVLSDLDTIEELKKFPDYDSSN